MGVFHNAVVELSSQPVTQSRPLIVRANCHLVTLPKL